MRTGLLILALVFFSVFTNESYAICVAEQLEWWEACNDTGLNNALPFDPLLLFVVFPIVIITIIASITIIFWRKRK